MTEVGNVELLVSLNTKALPQQVAAVQQQLAGKDANIKLNVSGAAEASAAVKTVDQGFQSAQRSAGGFFETAKQFVEAQRDAALFASGVQVISQQLEQAAAKVDAFKDKSLEAFKAYDSAIAKVSTIPGVDGSKLGADLNNLAQQTGYLKTGTDLLNGSYQILSAGFTKNTEVIAVNKAAVLASTGGFADYDTTAKALVGTLRAYGASADQAGQYADKFLSIQNNGLTTVKEFAGGLGQITPIAAALGVNFDDLAGAIGVATSNGVNTAESLTGIGAALQSLAKPSEEARQLAANLKLPDGTALQFNEVALRAKGLVGVLQDIKSTGKTSIEDLSTLFGSVQAARVIVPIINNLDKYKEAVKGSAEANGLAQAAADKVAASFEGQLTKATNQANAALVELGKGAKDAILPLLAALAVLVENFNALPAPVKEFTGGAIALVGSLLGLGAILTGVAATLPLVKAGFDLILNAVAGETSGIVINTAATEANAAAQATEAEATGAAAAAKNTAALTAGNLASGLGKLAVQGGLTAIAIGAVAEAVSRFADGGKVFNDIADQGKKRLLDLELQADKTKTKLDSVGGKNKPNLPEEPPPTGIIDTAVDAFNKTPGFIKTGVKTAAGLVNPLAGLLPDNITTDAEKKLNDARLGVGNLTDVSGQVVAKAQSVNKTTPTEDAAKIKDAVTAQLADTDKALGSLDPAKLGTKAYAELKEKLESSKKELEASKAALDKYVPSADAASSATGKLSKATESVAGKQKDAQIELKKIQADSALRDATFANSKQDTLTGIKKTQTTFGTDEDRAITQQTNAAEIASNQAQIAETEKALERVRELKKLGGEAGVQAEQQEAQLVTKLSGLRASAAEKEIADRRLAAQIAIDLSDRKFKAEEAAINRQTAAAKLNSAPGQVETSAIDEQQTLKVIALKQREFAETEKQKKNGVLGTKEATEKEQQLEAALDNERLKLLETRRARERADIEERDKLAEASIQRQASAAILAARSRQLSGGGLTGEGGQAEVQRIQETATQQTIAQKQRELAEVNQLEARKVIGVREAENQKLSILQAIDQARSQLLDQQTQRELRAIQNVADARKRELQTATAGIDQQKASNDLLLGSLQREGQLVEAQAKVSAAVAEARQQQLKAAVDRSSEAVEDFKKLQDKNLGANQRGVLQAQVGQLAGGVNPNDAIALVRNKQAAEAEADREKLAALKQQQEAERKTEELKLRQAEVTARNNVLEAQRANITARIAENEQKANLLKALKTGDQNEIANAQQGLALASQNVAITGAQIGNAQANAATQSQVGGLELQALGIRQNTALQAQQEQNATAGRSRANELAQTADQAGVRIGIDPNGGAAGIGISNVTYNAGQTTNAGQTFGGNGFNVGAAATTGSSETATAIADQKQYLAQQSTLQGGMAASLVKLQEIDQKGFADLLAGLAKTGLTGSTINEGRLAKEDTDGSIRRYFGSEDFAKSLQGKAIEEKKQGGVPGELLVLQGIGIQSNSLLSQLLNVSIQMLTIATSDSITATNGKKVDGAAIAPTKTPTNTPLSDVTMPTTPLSQLGNTLSSAIDRLGKTLAASMSRPNLTVSSPQPVNDAAKIMADSSKNQVSQAGL